MKFRIIKGLNNVGRELVEISTNQTRVVIGFGEDTGTGEIASTVNPMIEGLTVGNPSYHGVFILRNPENCNIVNTSIKTIPIFMERKLKYNFEICSDFLNLEKKNNIVQLNNEQSMKIGDLEVTPYLIDPSNFNTYMLKFKDARRKSNISIWRF